MRFTLTDEQRGFAAALTDLLSGADVPAATRAWARDEPDAGLALWRRLAEQGVCGLAVPEEAGGLGASPVDLCVAFEALGRSGVPGPWVESAAYLPALLSDPDALGRLADGEVGTVAVPPLVPRALDAAVASQVYVVQGTTVSTARLGATHDSVDPARRLVEVDAADPVAEVDASALERAFDQAVLAVSAQLLGLGEHLLATTVTYVKQRRQFGREIGSYQALKHQLADVRIALDFARPLVLGAAVTFDGSVSVRSRDVSAARVRVGDAAYLAARTALQLHGAIGYTEEHDLSLAILKVRALVGTWGGAAFHRARVLEALTVAADA
ncbi:acyl-CoA dehydrogenase [Nocardioides sp. HDW12B]|uniref:acyl-CoA dehydrogenase family protein n=1 Tax=Nocardioides sp. HDW12B TaxID=2714939 RepID=UPI00140AFF7B|nr:acyl-CoA dehydrogenase family protein [Nocardioides sp. HDW12B]QIK66245.1 acyl-CoA dehydrogenase [Nocardioides sp. HDW12B]